MPIDPRVQLGRRIRNLRQRAALSQEQLAERADLDRTYISGIERGKRNVALLNLAAISKALGVTVSELLKGIA